MDSIDDLKELLPQFSEIVKLELDVAKKEKEMVKREVARTTARAKFAYMDQALAQFSQRYAVERKNLAEKKRENQVNLELKEEEVKRGERASIFYAALAKAELAISDMHKKLTVVEKEVATARLDLANAKIIAGKKGLKLIKIARTFANAFKKKLPDEVLKRKKQDYTHQQQAYNERKEHVAQLAKRLNELQVNHADLKKELALKISEREKIRP